MRLDPQGRDFATYVKMVKLAAMPAQSRLDVLHGPLQCPNNADELQRNRAPSSDGKKINDGHGSLSTALRGH
jgi:hypothetical protein